MQDTQNNCPISDTPVTRLSRILSKARVAESKARSSRTTAKVWTTTSCIPADIDENANQEAPTATNMCWHLTCPIIDTQDSSHSFSSGYYSSSVTRSAPQLHTCSISSNLHIQASESSGVKRSPCIEAMIAPHTIAFFDRRHSSASRDWLTKRQKRRRWPRIAGISGRFSKDGLNSSLDDTNSCPAALFSSYNEEPNTPQFQIPVSTKMIPTKQSEEKPVPISCSSTARLKNCQNRSLIDNFFSPLAKRRRTESLSSPERQLVSTHDNQSLDDTIPIEVENPESVEPDAEEKSVDCVRLHSTPTLSKRPLVLKIVTPVARPQTHSFSETKPPDAKLAFSRCISVPVQTAERNQSKVDNRHSSMVCNDSWASVLRPRALPIIDRTASGLHCVSPDVIAQLVREDRRKTSESYRNVQHVIIDCRFPYEYEGGHIKGAINIFTHSDLVHEIFNRVPAQRPPGASGPPKLLGDGLSRRLAATVKEPLSAPCELASPEDDEDYFEDYCDEDESWIDEEIAEEQASSGDHDNGSGCSSSSSSTSCSNSDADPHPVSEAGQSSGGTSKSGGSAASHSTVELTVATGFDHPVFVVIFHCEFSSQRAPDLAAFLRNVDRLSNYHRYPFLYFPEIYIMQGGYSAFYRKYPRLCCPKRYVKMFHRDFRNHLRLYRRLTKRVSSACLACIRPQNRILGNSCLLAPDAAGEAKDCIVEPLFGLDFSGNTTFGIRPPLLPSPCSTSGAARPFHRSKSQASVVNRCPTLDDENNKENMLAGPSNSTFELTRNLSMEGLGDNALQEKPCNSELFVQQSPAGERPSSAGTSHERATRSDSPLSVAEAVVRAGHRVMAATLTSAALSAEVVEALDNFHRRATLPIPVGLRRANTVMNMFRESDQKGLGARKRPASNSTRDLLPLASVENLQTPLAGRLKRANTLGSHFSLEVGHKETGADDPAACTPILSISRQAKVSVDPPTVDYEVCSNDSP